MTAPLVYLSLGSLGSADVELMRRLIDVLGETEHRVIVSKGPQHELFDARGQHGGRGVPAAAVDPAAGRPGDHARREQHRTECFHFGKPMIVLPLFWDQYDNAQRVDELGFGVRLDTYAFEEAS